MGVILSVRALELLRGRNYWDAMDRDLFERVGLDGSYAARIVRFEDGSVFYVFERNGAAG